MLKVIGVSVTMEYTVKMMYENTIGEVFGWFSSDTLSEEEKVIAAAQRAYSDFIYHTAWYEFEFLPWIGQVWATSGSADASWLRKWERTFFFTLEFSFKALYAQLIEWAAKASYEDPVTSIYLLVSSNEPIKESDDVKIVDEKEGRSLLGITRWGAFTKSMLQLSDQEIDILEIGGNDEIVVSILMDKAKHFDFNNAELLYDSEVVSDESVVRRVYLLPVNRLMPFIRSAKANAIEVEHIFDY